MASANPIPLARTLRATCMALLVFGLGLLANAPAAHAWVHRVATSSPCHAEAERDDSSPFTAAHDDATCAITLFAQGAPAPAPAPEIEAPASREMVTAFAAPEAPAPATPGHLRPPGQAPPTLA